MSIKRIDATKLDIPNRHGVPVTMFANEHVSIEQSGINQLLSFLEIDDTFQPELEVVNPNMVVRSPGFRDFLRNPPASVRAIGRALVRDQRVRRALGHRVNSLNSVTTERPPLDPSVRARLQAIYASQIDELEDLLHRDLGAWRQSPGT